MWADRAFADMAGAIRASVVLAAVRSATPPLPVDQSASPPFRADHWLFALNGWVEGFAAGRNADLRAGLSRRRAATIEGASDAEVVFAMVLDRLDDGLDPAGALRAVHEELADEDTAPRNLFLSDGGAVLATRWRNSLFVHDAWRGGRVVASEPLDDGAGWTEVPDASLVVVRDDAITIDALTPPTREVPA
jgi:glutamine amidotransferase